MPFHRDHWVTDPTAAPLAHPAIAVACVLLIAAVAEIPRLPLFAHDYGSTLVYPAFVLYSTLAVLLLRWGWHSRPTPSGASSPATGLD